MDVIFQLLVPPMRLIIPTNYPENGAYLSNDQWSKNRGCYEYIYKQFEKRLCMASNRRSISEIASAWKIASEHVICVRDEPFGILFD